MKLQEFKYQFCIHFRFDVSGKGQKCLQIRQKVKYKSH